MSLYTKNFEYRVVVGGAAPLRYRLAALCKGTVVEHEFESLFSCATTSDMGRVWAIHRLRSEEPPEKIVDREVEWRDKWQKGLPPFSHFEVRSPSLAIRRLSGSSRDYRTALRLWQSRVEPLFTCDPAKYPIDWEWRRLWVWDQYKKCCGPECPTPDETFESPLIDSGVHGDTDHVEVGHQRTHALDNLQLLCRFCHRLKHGSFHERPPRICIWVRYRPGESVRPVLSNTLKGRLRVGDVLDVMAGNPVLIP